MKKMRPLVSAWVGQGNFGDELLSYGLRLEIKRSAEVDFFSYYESGGYSLYSDGVSDNARLLNIGRPNRLLGLARRYFQSLSGYDTFFFGGGSIFHTSNSILWKHQLLRKARKENPSLNSAAVGISLGPFPDVHAERQALAFLQELDLIHCRDSASMAFAQQLAGKVRLVQGRDLAFSVKALCPQLFISRKLKGRVGLSFILDPKLGAAEKERRFLKMQALVDFLTFSGNEVVLVGLYTGAKYSDDRLHDRLFSSAKNKSLIRILHYKGDVPEIISCISSCSFYISMRLHGLITAFLSGVPFFALSSHSKVVEFCGSVAALGLGGEWGDFDLDFTILKERITFLLSQSCRYQVNYEASVDEIYMAGSSSLAGFLR